MTFRLTLTDPLWERLYGPYGITNVSSVLCALQRQWSQEQANDLYWEQLHHQDTLYPVTYAALPWLWERAPQDDDNLIFFSHLVACAGTAPTLNGLSDNHQNHAASWLPHEKHLTPQDMAILRQIEQTYLTLAPQISKAALDAWRKDGAQCALIAAHCALRGERMLGIVVEWIEAGQSDQSILDDIGPMPATATALCLDLADLIAQSRPILSQSMRLFAQHPAHETPPTEYCANTPDLFL